MNKVIEINAIKTLGNFQLKVSLDVNENEKVFIKGPNGSGKTTLLYLLYGILRPNMGYIKIFGEEPSVKMRQDILYMSEEHLIFLENLSLNDNLKFIFSLRRFDYDNVYKLLNLFNIPLDKKPYQLSSGQRKLAKLSLAFSSMAKILLLDEPTANLDVENSKIISEMIKKYNGTVVFASHDELLNSTCNKMVYLRVGNVERVIEC
ncbi:ABC transporter ATP-binding protein [Acidianus ambivalens]|uniref:ATP-binding cassette domain-containing protein n=1 Tax=Acidianus ambivalens TaxID=2283 RepID=A0A650CV73_ACIAM|nr:ATP-binding cassette domain-containing protein [Acidianus ambivalens]MQL55760.1 ATP-binding cassette domain-containing protein [Acidianus ambivalens]QGR21668.1 ATP-binding cassette domain-containing protein [Acidianus ambivalens]